MKQIILFRSVGHGAVRVLMQKQFVTVLALLWLMFSVSGQASAEPIYAVTSPAGVVNIISFDSATPGTINATRRITGLLPNEAIGGIDFRPANGLLYGVSYRPNNTPGPNRIYIINPETGAATLVSTLNQEVRGSFGIDFDPVENQLRVVDNAGSRNLRIDADTGEVTLEQRLTYAPGDRNAPRIPGAVGLAYTNSVAEATEASLFTINTNGGPYLAALNPPNEGTLNTVGLLGFGTNSSELVGFDISGATGTAYATFAFARRGSSLFTVDLNTGLATEIDRIGGNLGPLVIGLAAPVAAPIPEPATLVLLGTGLAGIGAAVRKQRGSVQEQR